MISLMSIKVCPKCSATWIENQHYWTATQKKGNETELASLVCDKFEDDTCINPAKGTTDGNGWQTRLNNMDQMEKDLKRMYE